MNILDIVWLRTSTERSNTETVAFDALDIGDRQVCDTSVDCCTVITHNELRVSKDNVFGPSDTPSVGVSGEIGISGAGAKVDVFKDDIVGTSDSNVSSRSIDNSKVTKD